MKRKTITPYWCRILAAAQMLSTRPSFKKARLSLLANVCAVLDERRKTGDGCFLLSTYEAGDLLGVSHVTAWKDLKKLGAYGVIKEIEPGSTRGKMGRATIWKYDGHKRITG